MLLEKATLSTIRACEVMNKKILKINYTMNIKEIIEKMISFGYPVAVIENEVYEKEINCAILTLSDILKIIHEKIDIEDYIVKNDKTIKFLLNEEDTLKHAIDIMTHNNLEYVPVIRQNTVVGLICMTEIFFLYNDILSNRFSIFFKIFDNIHDAICVVDRNGITRFWNKSAEKLYKIGRKEMLNKPITDFFPNALLPKVIKEEKVYDNVYNKPRENCYNIISAKPLYYKNELIGGVSCDRDVTELIRISNLLDKTRSDLQVLEHEISTINENRFSFSQIVGNDVAFKETINFCKSISKSNINVLIIGESGTGKEVFARAVHIESGRKGYFVPINCSAIPSELMESELFGYEGGAFTGALKKGKKGKFEIAHEGTLFLDEIGDMPMKMQPKILRALEDGEIVRVGSDTSIKVDVRIIAATNKNLEQMMREGLFRKDLFYRLNSVLINLPPLRERKKDIPFLVTKFIEDFCITYRTNILEIPNEVMEMLIHYDWEGNIRELKNIIERIVILSKNNKNSKIDISYLPDSIVKNSNGKIKVSDKPILDLTLVTENAEKKAIIKAMKISQGNKAHAAKLLNIPRSTLYFKLKKYNMEK